MEYTIQEVMVNQIVVRFADDTIAVVGGIGTDTPPEVIDHFVSYHDPEYATPVELLVNELVAVGEKRTSNPISGWEEQQHAALVAQAEDVLPEEATNPYVGGIPQIADYLARKGDTRLRDALDAYLIRTLTTPGVEDIDPQQYIDFLERSAAYREQQEVEEALDADAVWNQALAELEEE